MKHKLESRLLGYWNINNLRYTDDKHPYGRKWRVTKEHLDESERGGELKSWLKTQNSKYTIIASSPIISWQIDGGVMETVTDFIF